MTPKHPKKMIFKNNTPVVSADIQKHFTNESIRRLYTLYERLDEFFVEGCDAGVMPALASVFRLKWMEKFHKR